MIPVGAVGFLFRRSSLSGVRHPAVLFILRQGLRLSMCRQGVSMNIGWTTQTRNVYVPGAADLTLAPIYDHAGHIGLMLVAAAPGDANFDGIVDVADLGIVGANWIASQTRGNTSALAPEPTTLSLLTMSVLVIGRRRRQRLLLRKTTLILSSLRWHNAPRLTRVFFTFS